MRMDSGYTPAFHMSRTLLSRVNSKSGGKVRVQCPILHPFDTDASMTAAPVAVLEDIIAPCSPRWRGQRDFDPRRDPGVTRQ